MSRARQKSASACRVGAITACELDVAQRDDPGAQGNSFLQIAHGPGDRSAHRRGAGDVAVWQQHQLDAAPLLQLPRIMVGWIFMHVADDLVAGPEAVAVGDQVDSFRCVLDEGQVVGRRAHEPGGSIAQTVEDRVVSAIDERTSPVLRSATSRSLARAATIQRGDAAMRQEHILVLDREPLAAFVEHHGCFLACARAGMRRTRSRAGSVYRMPVRAMNFPRRP